MQTRRSRLKLKNPLTSLHSNTNNIRKDNQMPMDLLDSRSKVVEAVIYQLLEVESIKM